MFCRLASPPGPSARFEAFRGGLRELGYIEGQNIAIEWRFAEGKDDRLPDLAAELVRLKVDVLLTIYSRSRTGETVEYVVFRRGDIKVRMRQELDHRRPHFHIEYKDEFGASYAVDTLERLAGRMPPRYERPILDWVASNRPVLEATWRELQRGGNGLELGLSGDPEPKSACG